MKDLNTKHILIYLKYTTYYKSNSQAKSLFKLLPTSKSNRSINFISSLPLKNKYFTLMKSPKCYKISKLLLKYSYKNFFFLIKKKIKNLTLFNLIKLFIELKKLYLGKQLVTVKLTKITIKTQIDYNINFS